MDHNRCDGWDAANALEDDRWDFKTLKAWATQRVKIYTGAEIIQLDHVRQDKKRDQLDTEHLSPNDKWQLYGLTLTGTGKPYANEENVGRILRQHKPYENLVWYDTFYQRLFRNKNGKRVEWQDVDVLKLTEAIQSEFQINNLKPKTVENAVAIHGDNNSVNSVLDWLNALVWDDIPRIDFFIADCMGGANTDYIQAVSKNFWIMMVARVIEPGCKVDNMVVFQGNQGLFKTSTFEVIGGEWFMESTEPATRKDFYISIQGKLLVEIAELDSFSKADTTRIKQVITTRSDRYRGIWEKSATDHPRQCIFVGTTNEDSFLRDPTGARRYWVIKISEKMNVQLIRDQREQIFAEAVHRFNANETSWETPREATLAMQEEHRETDVWHDRVADYISDKDEVLIDDILDAVLNIEVGRRDRANKNRVGAILRSLGWKSLTKWRDGKPKRKWCPVKKIE